jgi:hypothetical protein
MFFKKPYHNILGGGKRNFSDTHYTPFTNSTEQVTNSLSVCSESFRLQIEQKGKELIGSHHSSVRLGLD